MSFDNLRGHQFLNLTTYRANGEPVTTTVWFSLAGGVIRLASQADAGKIRRISKNGVVRVEPATVGGKPLGPAVEGSAAILDAADGETTRDVLAAKYGLQWRLFSNGLRLTGRPLAYVEIRPSDRIAA